jgi:3-oxoacyl-[acyl-carrier-protein] synthase III
MDGLAILNFVTTKVSKQILSLLRRSGLTADDIALFIFHQASQVAMDSLRRALRLKREKVYCNVADVGNTVSASIPIALQEARDRGLVARGDKLLLSGFGVGLSWSSTIPARAKDWSVRWLTGRLRWAATSCWTFITATMTRRFPPGSSLSTRGCGGV